MADGLTPERFPERMRSKDRWIGWIWGERGTRRRFRRDELEPHDGHLWYREPTGKLVRADKLPIDIRTMRLASVSNPDTWASFDDVVTVMRSGAIEGPGYVLDEGEALLDLDGCMTDGEPNAFASNLVAKFATYAELSASGEGIHIVCVADGFVPDRGYKGGRMEVYVGGHTNRYCTVTGSVLEGFEELNDDAEDVLLDVYATEFKERPVLSAPHDTEAKEVMDGMRKSDLSPDDRRAAAWTCGHFKNARAMLKRGDISGWVADREKHWNEDGERPSTGERRPKDISISAADASLASYLLAATKGDADATLAILRSSKMWRPKFDEVHDGTHTYAVMTVARALNACPWEKIRSNALARRDELLEQYPADFAPLVELMKRDDVTHYMLQRVMCTRARGTARRKWRDPIETYPLAWMIRWWDQLVEVAYDYSTYDFPRGVMP